jgi:protein-S-isoprenylcysteine O-methyltransferase Ste14
MTESRIIQNLYRWRVRCGLLAALAGLILARPNILSLSAGFVIALAGMSLRTWACRHLKKEEELTTSGPYRYTRNPLYLGNLFIGVGIVVASRSWWALTIFLVYFLLFYPVAVIDERRKMARLFPEDYGAYSQKVPLFFPTLRPKLSPIGTASGWQLHKKNREHRALIGIALYWIVLLIKSLVF